MSEVINMHIAETIQTGGGFTPTGQIDITENGVKNVYNYATANVQVPQPSGKVTITQNGNDVDIAQYASADINVPQGITPTGTINISQNGDTDVTNYATAHVAVPQPSGKITITQNGTDVDISSYATADVNVQYDYYTKHIPDFVKSILALDIAGVMQDILINDTEFVGVNNRAGASIHSMAIVNRSTSASTMLSPCPTGADATDLPVNMSDFYNDGAGIVCRSIAETDDYYIVGMRYGAGIQIDGTHLYGGIAFISKSTKTVVKSYWLPYMVTRVVYNDELSMLAVGLQMAGISFYSVSGTTLTELETFLYDQSSGSPTRGRESQHGCFYYAKGHWYYANVGFAEGVIFYDVTDSSDITKAGELQLRTAWQPFSSGGMHTYTGIVRYPYMYLTIAGADKEHTRPDYDGVLTVDISNLSNIKVLQHEKVKAADCLVWNEFGDTKPTEMTNTQGMLYLNYENGYLAFEIDATGKSTHYCGRYSTNNCYGMASTANGDLYVGASRDNYGRFDKYVEGYVPPTVLSITATKTKTTYYTDETLSTDDITVMASYSDETVENVTSEAVFDTSGVDISTAGTYSIGVSYTYGGVTVTTTISITSEARPVTYTVVFDATYTGTLSAANKAISGSGAIIANNNKTYAGTSYASSTNSDLLNKPLYYRLEATEGVDEEHRVGFYGAAAAATGTLTLPFTYYGCTSTTWQPLMQDADPTAQMQIVSPNDRIWVGFRSASNSTATFPVTVNARIQIGYRNE